MGKCTQAEMDLRVKEVKDLLLVGETRSDIFRLASVWEVSERMVDEYIARARKELQEVNDASYEENRYLILKNLWALFIANREAQDRKGMLACISELVKVTGLAEIRINHLVEKLEGVDPSVAEAHLLEEMSEVRH